MRVLIKQLNKEKANKLPIHEESKDLIQMVLFFSFDFKKVQCIQAKLLFQTKYKSEYSSWENLFSL